MLLGLSVLSATLLATGSVLIDDGRHFKPSPDRSCPTQQWCSASDYFMPGVILTFIGGAVTLGLWTVGAIMLGTPEAEVKPGRADVQYVE
jgi:hypothetical protein